MNLLSCNFSSCAAPDSAQRSFPFNPTFPVGGIPLVGASLRQTSAPLIGGGAAARQIL